MKVVITRDDDGYMIFWPIKAFKYLDKEDDEWRCSNSNEIVEVEGYCIKGICKLLGFTPRKGSKQIVDITVKKK